MATLQIAILNGRPKIVSLSFYWTIIKQSESLTVHLSEKKMYKCLTDEGHSHNVMILFELHYTDKAC